MNSGPLGLARLYGVDQTLRHQTHLMRAFWSGFPRLVFPQNTGLVDETALRLVRYRRPVFRDLVGYERSQLLLRRFLVRTIHSGILD